MSEEIRVTTETVVEPKKKEKKEAVVPEAGNSDELKRLREEIARQERTNNRIAKELEDSKSEVSEFRKKYFSTKDALDAATKKIIDLETANNKSDDAKSEFVEIVAVTPDKSIKPLPVYVNGVPAPHRVNENGFHIFTVPKSNALRLIDSGNGVKFHLVGPVDEISGILPDGLYTKKVTYKKHSSRKSISGDVTWIPVEVN